jgi:hypothetical protein
LCARTYHLWLLTCRQYSYIRNSGRMSIRALMPAAASRRDTVSTPYLACFSLRPLDPSTSSTAVSVEQANPTEQT